jgi:voltage-gated potassium channel
VTDASNRELKGVGYELFILLLSVLSVFNMAFVWLAVIFTGVGGPAQTVVLAVDAIMTPIFVFDFLFRLLTAHSKRGYFFGGQGWADLLATIPMFRIFRIFRILRVVRLLRTYGMRRFVDDLVEARASATFLLTIFLVLLVIEAAGASIYYVESGDPDANIGSASDALWWGIVTITTVGYGDQFPVTQLGRVIGVFLLLSGIGLFSVLTGFIANVFLAPPKREPEAVADADEPRALIDGVRALLAEQEERSSAIRLQLEALERSLPPPVPPGAGSR